MGKYIPEFNEGKKKNITIRNLLTMSGGLNWDEAYASLFSVTTHGYYGNLPHEALGVFQFLSFHNVFLLFFSLFSYLFITVKTI